MFNLKNSSSVSSVNLSRAFLRAAGLLALFIVAASAVWLAKANAQNASAGQAQTAQEIPTLELGKPIERELAGGQSHRYQLMLRASQYMKVEVKQQGVDVVVALIGLDRKPLLTFR